MRKDCVIKSIKYKHRIPTLINTYYWKQLYSLMIVVKFVPQNKSKWKHDITVERNYLIEQHKHSSDINLRIFRTDIELHIKLGNFVDQRVQCFR